MNLVPGGASTISLNLLIYQINNFSISEFSIYNYQLSNQNLYQMIPSSFNFSISSLLNPISLKILSLCSPSLGANSRFMSLCIKKSVFIGAVNNSTVFPNGNFVLSIFFLTNSRLATSGMVFTGATARLFSTQTLINSELVYNFVPCRISSYIFSLSILRPAFVFLSGFAVCSNPLILVSFSHWMSFPMAR